MGEMSAIGIGHNGGWKMAGEFEAYIAAFNEADGALRSLHLAIGELRTVVTMLEQSPQALTVPGALQKWPTQDQLRSLYND